MSGFQIPNPPNLKPLQFIFFKCFFFSPSTREVKVGFEFEASLGYTVRPCLKTKQNKTFKPTILKPVVFTVLLSTLYKDH
jgi:hypothetical protein